MPIGQRACPSDCSRSTPDQHEVEHVAQQRCLCVGGSRPNECAINGPKPCLSSRTVEKFSARLRSSVESSFALLRVFFRVLALACRISGSMAAGSATQSNPRMRESSDRPSRSPGRITSNGSVAVVACVGDGQARAPMRVLSSLRSVSKHALVFMQMVSSTSRPGTA